MGANGNRIPLIPLNAVGGKNGDAAVPAGNVFSSSSSSRLSNGKVPTLNVTPVKIGLPQMQHQLQNQLQSQQLAVNLEMQQLSAQKPAQRRANSAPRLKLQLKPALTFTSPFPEDSKIQFSFTAEDVDRHSKNVALESVQNNHAKDK